MTFYEWLMNKRCEKSQLGRIVRAIAWSRDLPKDSNHFGDWLYFMEKHNTWEGWKDTLRRAYVAYRVEVKPQLGQPLPLKGVMRTDAQRKEGALAEARMLINELEDIQWKFRNMGVHPGEIMYSDECLGRLKEVVAENFLDWRVVEAMADEYRERHPDVKPGDGRPMTHEELFGLS